MDDLDTPPASEDYQFPWCDVKFLSWPTTDSVGHTLAFMTILSLYILILITA